MANDRDDVTRPGDQPRMAPGEDNGFRPEPDDDLPEIEPQFDLRRGLRVLIIVGLIVMVISVICIGLDSRYSP
ncbi:MAG TPA: hypothetical protein VIL01_15370 [Thermomicrobiales bacterium]